VIGIPDPKWGERVHAVIELRADLEHVDLIAFCRESLAGYKCPKSIDTIETVPLTPAGKIDKKPLREEYWPDKETPIG
jgi:acyl-CoA synthetase (AMP-forming)/AMP-acid ligase II